MDWENCNGRVGILDTTMASMITGYSKRNSRNADGDDDDEKVRGQEEVRDGATKLAI